MIADIDEFRQQLVLFVELLRSVIAEGATLPGPPEGLGFCMQADRVFSKHVRELDDGLLNRNVDHIVHAILCVGSDVEVFTEYDLTWSPLWQGSDARERLGKSAHDLVDKNDLLNRKPEILKQLACRTQDGQKSLRVHVIAPEID